MKKIRLAIVGCKNMGSKHVHVLQEHFAADIKISGILNSTSDSSQAKAAELNVPYFEKLADINKRNTDAVLISTPAESHYRLGAHFLTKNMPCLIEKPFAATEEECLLLMKQREVKDTPILIGHTENYNPAVIMLKEMLRGRKILSLSGIRTSNNPGFKDTHIISELMIHDIAIVNSLLGIDFETAVVSKDDKYRWDEHAIVEMAYWNKSIVRLEAIRADVDIRRRMRIIDDKQDIWQIDFAERRLSKNGDILTEGGNNLKNEWQNFIGIIRGEEEPFVSIEEARQNVRLCNQLEEISGAARNCQKNASRSCINQISSLYKHVER